jgi:hypothetical protein
LASGEKATVADRLKDLVPKSEHNTSTISLLGVLFPSLAEHQKSNEDHADAFYRRRPLLSALRLGLLPGAYSREKVRVLFESEPQIIHAQLKAAFDGQAIDPLTDRIDDLYSDQLPSSKAIQFWRGVAAFAAKQDCEWLRAYSPMHEKINNLSAVLLQAARRDNNQRDMAAKVFVQLKSDGEKELIAYWIRAHVFAFGLFGNEKRQGETLFLTLQQTEALVRDLAVAWRSGHLSGQLIQCRWDLQPVFTMVDMGIWDKPCQSALDKELENDAAVDGLTLLLYGGGYAVSRDTVGKICSLDNYIERAQKRLNSHDDIHDSVKVALQKALGRGVYG